MVAIRPLTPEDRAVWAPLWRAYLAFYETKLPEAVYAASFARMTDPEVTDHHGLLAFDGARAVGLVHYIFHVHGWRLEPVTYLQDLYAVPEARGTGVGRALIEAVYDAADAAGAPAVYWMTQAFNLEARRLYDRVGQVTPFIKYERPRS